jgi:hypothetical protein
MNDNEQPTTIYLSKADEQSLDRDPASHVIQKARDVNGNYDLLALEEKEFMGAITVYALSEGLTS